MTSLAQSETSRARSGWCAADATSDVRAPSASGAAGTIVPLHVDRTDPCFFDHPLDHIPGMLLVTALLDVLRVDVRRHADAGLNRLRISLAFDRICELGEPVLLHSEPAPDEQGPAWLMSAEQEDHTVCRAAVSLARTATAASTPTAATTPTVGPATATAATPGGTGTGPAPATAFAPEHGAAPVLYPTPHPTGQPPADHARPADAALVHRHHPENVLLGPSLRSEQAAVLVPPPGHRLHGGPEGLHTPAALIESARQMATLLGHAAHGRDPDAQMLWLTLEADVPTDLPTSVPLALRWEFAPARGARAPYPLALLHAVTGERLGRIEIAVHTLSRTRYLQRRAAQ
ncbi:AfsA-related hotdog domain-containing protein [Streptomyces sp. NPDC089799]|uniref:AfsA-related hotdog domain-containing protein n=1 Tax=Streptomyces sp. NPDC089799 TaxID=3155066 RepID=UPI0034149FA5